ncbi:site-2 protease family protein [Candidatus Chazhemtobacterium aquaticus]|uniref:Zn-dependent protease S2P/M50 family n=1 Tax=Candidatus Chazhemtobacterium aquaticus TaxID=2715735 RepID=A0A857N6L0_9BACT|nr:site-2 protease family protein [Candidatus Chazhemtobacterium aquaticus]QHO63766.1 Zn-dependent protease S2P/M50 family [Candidatus Chazhemtobacterium aquaticus]
MLETLFTNPLLFFVWILSLLIAISVHEAAHAYSAEYLGDPTPRLQGRTTLNPLAHLDPLGTLMLLLFRFGWGRPVQFDPYNLANPRRDAALISLAGPVSNLVLTTIASLLIHFILPSYYAPLLYPFVFLNVGLAIFNLIPVHPLDGGKILIGILPQDLAYEWQSIMNRYGTIILILLIFPINGVSPAISLITPVIDFLINLLLPTGGLI